MNYKNSRDAAWQILIKNKISRLPVSVEKICKAEKIKLCTYQDGEKIIKSLKLLENTIENDAFSIGRVIFYDDTKPKTRQRFSIAHEIGHIMLHCPSEATVLNREISSTDSPLEQEANIFASRILAPLSILHYLNVSTAEEISEICNISLIAAQIRYQRLCEIRNRDLEMKKTKGYGCFLLSPLERAVYNNFKDYISKNKRG
mgnify:CR=1 FL=1